MWITTLWEMLVTVTKTSKEAFWDGAGTQGGGLLTGPSGDLIDFLSHSPTLGMGMGTRTRGTTAPQCPTVPSRTQTAMDRVTPATRMMTTTESLTVGTTAAWCPTLARKTQTVRHGRGPWQGLDV